MSRKGKEKNKEKKTRKKTKQCQQHILTPLCTAPPLLSSSSSSSVLLSSSSFLVCLVSFFLPLCLPRSVVSCGDMIIVVGERGAIVVATGIAVDIVVPEITGVVRLEEIVSGAVVGVREVGKDFGRLETEGEGEEE